MAIQNAELYGAAERELVERRRAEEALRATTDRLRTVLEASPLAVVAYDTDARVDLWNPAAEALFGWSAAEAHGRALPPVPAEHRQAAADVRASARDGRVFPALDMPLCRRDGTAIDAVSSVAPLWNDAGAVTGAVVIVTDVTERRRAEAALRQRERLTMMGTLLASVAHELNNPLAVVLGQAQLLARSAVDDPGGRRRLDKLVAAAERCARIVKNFLALARQRPPERRPVQLNEIPVETLELFQHALQADGIDVHLALAPDLPPLWGDRDQLHQVVMNLLTNAHHALRDRPGPRWIGITTSHDTAQRCAVLEVADNGPGFSPGVWRRLFEPFFTTKPVGEGTGLGLPLCRSLVEAHGGRIVAAPRPGGGAVFRVELPVLRGDAAGAEAPPPPAADALTILVVDDEPDVAAVLAEFLEGDGHRVTVARSARAALDLLGSITCDVVITDIRMPDVDGPAFYREATRRHPDLASRFVFLTGDALNADTAGFLAERDAPTLEKPFTADDVRRALGAIGT